MKGSGGTEGGVGKYFIGFCLSALAAWMFFDSVQVSTAGEGWLSGMMHHQWRGGNFATTSMGIIFVPFFLGVIALFYDASKKWAWALMYCGLAVLSVEILSRIRFLLHVKSSHLLLMLAMFAAGLGLMLQSYRAHSKMQTEQDEESGEH